MRDDYTIEDFLRLLEAVGESMLYDKRRLQYTHRGERLNDVSLPEGHIALGDGRPERDEPINDEDIVDLRITLETTDSVAGVIKRV